MLTPTTEKTVAKMLGIEMHPVTDPNATPTAVQPTAPSDPTPPPKEPNAPAEKPKDGEGDVIRVKAHRVQKRCVIEFEDGSELNCYIIKMNGQQRAKWLDFQSKRTAVEGDMMRVTNFDQYYEMLLSMCLIYGPGSVDHEKKVLEGRLVPISVLTSLPGDTIFDVFDAASKLNRLGVYSMPDEAKK